VSFNPLKHIDPVGTILLPGILLLVRSPFVFGYAKPVPVNFRALRNPHMFVSSCSWITTLMILGSEPMASDVTATISWMS
jgi:Zn-dependent protease